MSVVAIIAGALLVPRLARDTVDPAAGFATAPPTDTATPSPQPSSGVPDGWVGRAGVDHGFSIHLPQDWRGGWFEGRWDFHPKGLPGINEGGDTFTVEVHSATFDGGPFDDLERETESS